MAENSAALIDIEEDIVLDKKPIEVISNKIVYNEENSFARENIGYHFIKRIADFVLALGAVLVLLPILLIVSLIIFLGDFHNPIFIQERLTKHGKRFKMLKFRSMCANAEEKLKELHKHNEVDGPAFKMGNDPRVTKIGRFIRKTSIDELPQLINIIVGDMSIVGPRPPLPSEVEQYNDYQMHRLDVKTGLTCYWQCSGRSNLSFDAWVDLDVKYIKEMSVATDVKIIAKTFKAVIKRDGAK